MSRAGQKKRVFMLGAGFSSAAGLPLAPKLRDLLIERIPVGEDERPLLAVLRKQLGVEASPEQLADATRNVAQLEHLWARACSPSRTTIEQTNGNSRQATPEEHLEATERHRSERERTAAWLESSIPDALERALPVTLLACHPDKSPGYLEQFVGGLRPTDTVITFNYDVLVERALQDARVPFDLGFSPRKVQKLSLLKLHGSIDWFALNLKGQARPELEVLYDSGRESIESDVRSWRLVRESRKEHLPKAIQSARYPVGDVEQGEFYKLAFPGFGVFKRVVDVPGLWFVWQNAWDAIRGANEVYMVGYSLPPTDTLVRLALGLFFNSRGAPLDRLLVMNPADSIDIDDLSRVFHGQVEHRAVRAEDVEWHRL